MTLHLPSSTDTHTPAYPNFSARIPILFSCQQLSVQTILPCHYPSTSCKEFVFLSFFCFVAQFTLLALCWGLHSVLRILCSVFLSGSGYPHLLPSLPQGWVRTHSPATVMFSFCLGEELCSLDVFSSIERTRGEDEWALLSWKVLIRILNGFLIQYTVTKVPQTAALINKWKRLCTLFYILLHY